VEDEEEEEDPLYDTVPLRNTSPTSPCSSPSTEPDGLADKMKLNDRFRTRTHANSMVRPGRGSVVPARRESFQMDEIKVAKLSTDVVARGQEKQPVMRVVKDEDVIKEKGKKKIEEDWYNSPRVTDDLDDLYDTPKIDGDFYDTPKISPGYNKEEEEEEEEDIYNVPSLTKQAPSEEEEEDLYDVPSLKPDICQPTTPPPSRPAPKLPPSRPELPVRSPPGIPSRSPLPSPKPSRAPPPLPVLILEEKAEEEPAKISAQTDLIYGTDVMIRNHGMIVAMKEFLHDLCTA